MNFVFKLCMLTGAVFRYFDALSSDLLPRSRRMLWMNELEIEFRSFRSVWNLLCLMIVCVDGQYRTIHPFGSQARFLTQIIVDDLKVFREWKLETPIPTKCIQYSRKLEQFLRRTLCVLLSCDERDRTECRNRIVSTNLKRYIVWHIRCRNVNSYEKSPIHVDAGPTTIADLSLVVVVVDMIAFFWTVFYAIALYRTPKTDEPIFYFRFFISRLLWLAIER